MAIPALDKVPAPVVQGPETLETRFWKAVGSVGGSKKITAAISAIFGGFVSNITGSNSAGLFAGASAFLFSENCRLKVENAAVWKYKGDADENIQKAGVDLTLAPRLSAENNNLRQENEMLKRERGVGAGDTAAEFAYAPAQVEGAPASVVRSPEVLQAVLAGSGVEGVVNAAPEGEVAVGFPVLH